MKHGLHPDAIDTRLVLRIYAWIATLVGLLVADGFAFFMTRSQADYDLLGIPWGRVGIIRVAGSVIAAFGFTAIGLSRIENPVSRARALKWFAIGHALPGFIFFGATSAILDRFIPPVLQWLPLAVGLVLLYIAVTSSHIPIFKPRAKSSFSHLPSPVLVERARGGDMASLRSQYEEQIRQAARLEERARLARDLHDAVKQQLFAVQTGSATAQARFASDNAGALAAIGQVRVAARDAMTEMEALIHQLQAAPLENTGLIAALKQQCEALALRTGADVKFETGTLPSSEAVPPGTQQTLFRVAQEALANVAKHARAHHVTVRLGLSGNNLELIVQDDGAGFNPTETQKGMGTENMKVRIGDVAGTFLLRSARGGGTTIGFSVPCDTSTSRDYLTRAVIATLVMAGMGVTLALGDDWGPWRTVACAIAAVTAVRFAIASYRLRGRAEVLA